MEKIWRLGRLGRLGRMGRLGRLGRLGRQGGPKKPGKWGDCKYWGHWRDQAEHGDLGVQRDYGADSIFYLILFYEIFIFTNLLIELFEMISKSSPSPLDVFCKLNLKQLLVFLLDFPNVWLAY